MMPARPARTPVAPSTAIPASWNPAVPPPPVTGAAVGTGLNEGLGLGLAEGLTLTLVDALAEVVATPTPTPTPVAVTVTLTVTPSLTVGDKIVTGTVEGLDVQAESARQASTAVRPHPAAVSRTRCAVHA